MKLWFVNDTARWGYSLNVVRAETDIDAARLAGANPDAVEVIELVADGPAGVLWCRDESPDTGD